MAQGPIEKILARKPIPLTHNYAILPVENLLNSNIYGKIFVWRKLKGLFRSNYSKGKNDKVII